MLNWANSCLQRRGKFMINNFSNRKRGVMESQETPSRTLPLLAVRDPGRRKDESGETCFLNSSCRLYQKKIKCVSVRNHSWSLSLDFPTQNRLVYGFSQILTLRTDADLNLHREANRWIFLWSYCELSTTLSRQNFFDTILTLFDTSNIFIIQIP